MSAGREISGTIAVSLMPQLVLPKNEHRKGLAFWNRSAFSMLVQNIGTVVGAVDGIELPPRSLTVLPTVLTPLNALYLMSAQPGSRFTVLEGVSDMWSASPGGVFALSTDAGSALPGFIGDVTAPPGSNQLTIVDGAVTSAKIADGTIATADLQDALITTGKIADSAVTSAKIADGTIATADLQDALITTGKIADSAVTSAKIADGTIATVDLADGAVTLAKQAQGAAYTVVGNPTAGAAAKQDVAFATLNDAMYGSTRGSIVVRGGSSYQGVTPGPAGTVWTSNGPGADPSYQVPGSTGQLSGFRNRMVNGGMAVDQRNAGAAQTYTAGAALAYGVDRWYGYATGANVSGQRIASAGLFAYQFTGAAGVTGIGFGQRIEAGNSADLAGSSAVLSVDLANSALTTVTWTAYYANSADTFGTLASPTRTQIATGTFTVTSALARYSTVINIPSAATTGIEIVLSVAAQTSGTWVIRNVQLETGSVATAFERRHNAFETALCQRYYWISSALSGGWGGGTGAMTASYTFPVTMRVTPTLTLLNGSVNGGSALEIAVAQRAVTSIGANATNTSGGRADFNATSSGTYHPGILEAGTVGFSAEL